VIAPEISAALVPTGQAAGSWWERWRELAAEPALVEAVIVFGLGLAVVLVALRWSRLVREMRQRTAVSDYLFGVEQALSGDLAGATKRLRKVIAEDPENHHARLLLGEVLAELGEPAQAHQHHLVLQQAFKLASGRNDLALARNLLDLGRSGEAVVAAQRAAQAAPDGAPALRLLFQAQLAAGFPEDAGRTGRRLARVLPDGEERARVLERAGAALALAAGVQAAAGAHERAAALAREAATASPEGREVRAIQARLALDGGGKQAMLAALGAPGEQSGALVPAAAAPAASPAALIGALAPSTGYACKTCRAPLALAAAVCPHCGARGAADRLEPRLFDDLASPGMVLDEIEESRSYVRRLVEQAAAGDEAAALDLQEMGDSAVEEMLAAAMHKGSGQERLIGVLQRMGPSIVAPLFEAWVRLKDKGLLHLPRIGLGPSPRVLGRIVSGFGREALPYFERLFGTADRTLRKVIVDYFIGLGDQGEFEKVLERVPPVEVIHRLNEAPPGLLLRLLATIEPQGFLADVLLLEPIFLRDEELFLAARGAAHPDVLIGVLQRRGYNPALTKLAIEHLVDGELAEWAGRLLDGFGRAAFDHLVSAFTDLDRPAPLREALERRIAAFGADVVETLCSFFGPGPAGVDADLIRVLVSIGPRAVEALAAAFAKSGLFERLGTGLVSRYTHRRAMMIQALSALEAHATLRALRERESDPNLKLRLSQALQKAPPADQDDRAHGERRRGDHGQAG
jgi:tetratricopeptide (TPR) repeat protein